MAQVELVMPKMGESIIEATILNWVKKQGDTVKTDETILEIATDKVDSEIPSPVDGTILKTFFVENDVVEIGKVIAIIGTAGDEVVQGSPAIVEPTQTPEREAETHSTAPAIESKPAPVPVASTVATSSVGRFYSPLVKNIASKEGIAQSELDQIPGSGKEGRVTKKDILDYLKEGRTLQGGPVPSSPASKTTPPPSSAPTTAASSMTSGNVEIIEMDRMRRMIADHMVMSKHTSPHVTSFVEVDVTNMVQWRNKMKGEYEKKYGERITFTPLFIEACIMALKEFPMVNVSIEGNNIIKKNDINIGMAAALPSGNLIVPVIHRADHLNLIGLTAKVNDLANRARSNKLKPEEIQGGTFTLTNVGTFGNAMGTPIINQPQVAIMATGSIKKKPAVLETQYGDVIAVRQMMFLSLSYDHRVVDGMLGGSFLRRVGDILESFDPKRMI